jgi:hypothetical protein
MDVDNRVAGFEGEDVLPIWSTNDNRRPNSILPGQLSNNLSQVIA